MELMSIKHLNFHCSNINKVTVYSYPSDNTEEVIIIDDGDGDDDD